VSSEDLLVYADENYLIYRRHGAVLGSLDSALHITQIGVLGLGDVRPLVADDGSWREILTNLIEDIAVVRDGRPVSSDDEVDGRLRQGTLQGL